MFSSRSDSKTKNAPGWSWGIVLFVVVFLFCFFKINESDVFMHIRNGEYIVETGSIPVYDVFSFTCAGRPWVNHEWLFGLAAYFVHLATGYQGVNLMKMFVISLSFLIMWRIAVLSGASPSLTAAIGAAAASAARFHFFARPQIFTYLFTAVFFGLLLRKKKGIDYKLLWLPVLMIPWTNIHAACVIGPALIALHLAVAFAASLVRAGKLSDIEKKEKQGLLFEGIILASCFLASLINPNGIHVWTYIGQVTGIEGYTIREWSAAVSFFQTPKLFVFLILVSALALITVKFQNAFAMLYLAASAYGTVKSIRHAEFLALMALPGAGISLGRALNNLKKYRSLLKHSLPLFASVLILCIILTEYHTIWGDDPRLFRFGLGVNTQLFSYKVPQYLEYYDIDGRFYNDGFLGGFIMQEWPGKPEVFLDGRADVYRKLHQRLMSEPFMQIMDDYSVKYAVIDNSWGDNRLRDMLLMDKQNWALTLYGDYYLLLLRRIPEHEKAIRETEVHYYRLNLDFSGFSVEDRNRALAEFKELSRLHPDTAYNFLAVSQLSILNRDFDTARTFLKRALRIESYRPLPYLTLAHYFMAQNQWKKAEKAVEAAKQRRAAGVFPNLLYAETGMRTGDYAQAIKALKRVLELNPRILEAWDMLISAYRSNGNIRAAMRAEEESKRYRQEMEQNFQRMEQEKSEAWRQALAAAENAMNNKDIPGAEKAFLHALKIKPEEERSWLNLARFYDLQGQMEQAVDTLNQGLKNLPRSIPLKTALGLTLLKQGKIDQAQKNLQPYLDSPEDLPGFPTRDEIKTMTTQDE